MRLPILFILITVVLDAMGIGLIMPIMPDLIREVRGGTLAGAALWGGILSTVFAVMQFGFGPLVGSLSDRFGRRPVLLISLFFMTLDYLVMALAGSIWLLLAARIVGGITAATHATASAFMADISAPEDKAANFGLIGAGFGIGFVLGPLMGGLLAEYGTRAPFYAAAALSALNLLLGACVLRETVRRPRAFSWARANPLGAFRHLSRMPGIRPLLVVFFLYNLALYVYPAIWAYFTQARFGWSPDIIGLSLALYGITSALVQTVLIRSLMRHWGERLTVLQGLFFDIGTCLLLAVVTSGTVALILTPLAAIGAVVTPALQGTMSRQVADDAQGELQGVLSSVNALAVILSTMVMTSVFAAFTAPAAPVQFAGAPFLLAALLLVIALVIYRRQVNAAAGAA
ncbi:tetracycline resistance MFS efflux pump [Pseudooceanicola lipolyticus]|uniref:Tetracycline resistance MFS efflux pump n=1 Tax=Pseudooceanicola lipolyticus TaxID=2029104 RepID=A0A2M8IXC6_9RHOB|nr:TCR/Tet family MFS transporter [Pseudooceanicola lipolyticus]PJE35138.1 tetracycline resistance MFS efflux pump [Pseudooceanicola lipolyticus]